MISALSASVAWGFALVSCRIAYIQTGERKFKIMTYVSLAVMLFFVTLFLATS